MTLMTAGPPSRFESRSRYDGYSWKPAAQSLTLLDKARELLTASPRPMTVRQLYYRLVAGLVIPNNIHSYQNLVGLLTKARKVDLLDTSKFVDRARAVTGAYGYASLESYLDIVSRAYRRRPHDGQPEYIEVWTEKDALSAVIGDVVRPYGATLVVSKGSTSYTVLVEAARRFHREIADRDADHVHLLYFGDFDPSGEDIFRVIGDEMIALTGDVFDVRKVALTQDLIDEHGLPPMPAKTSDSRLAGFQAAHGDEAVELDALPPDVLEDVVREAVEEHWDEGIHTRLMEAEEAERAEMLRAVEDIRKRRER